MYGIVRDAYDTILIDREFSRKTAKLVQDHTKSGTIQPTLDIYELDGDTLRKIEESSASDTEKVFNLLKSIHGLVDSKGIEEPYLIPIGEKADHIAELFKERQITVQEALKMAMESAEEAVSSMHDRAATDMPVATFSIFWVMKKEGISDPEDRANYMAAILERYPHWKSSEKHARAIRQELYKVLMNSGSMDMPSITGIVDSIMRIIKGGGSHDA